MAVLGVRLSLGCGCPWGALLLGDVIRGTSCFWVFECHAWAQDTCTPLVRIGALWTMDGKSQQVLWRPDFLQWHGTAGASELLRQGHSDCFSSRSLSAPRFVVPSGCPMSLPSNALAERTKPPLISHPDPGLEGEESKVGDETINAPMTDFWESRSMSPELLTYPRGVCQEFWS